MGRGLPTGSRVVIAGENQSAELVCDTSDALNPMLQRLATRRALANSDKVAVPEAAVRQLLVADPNGTLVALDSLGSGSGSSQIGPDLSIILTGDEGQRQQQSLQQDSLLVAGNHQHHQHQQQQQRLKDEEPADYLVSLVFWYKDDNPAPIYTLDARQSMAALDPSQTGAGLAWGRQQQLGGSQAARQVAQMNGRLLAAAKHYHGKQAQSMTPKTSTTATMMAGQNQIRDRPRIKTDEWPVIKLQLSRVGPVQAGDYKCRVDFRRARTIRRTVRLFVEGKFEGERLEESERHPRVTSRARPV